MVLESLLVITSEISEPWPRPSLCVVGTSNSVFADGYTGVLRAEFPTVVNRSIGFSSSHVLTYRKGDLDFGQYEVCIIECACNDGSLFLSGLTTAELIEQSLLDMLEAMASTPCLPLVLILPVSYLYPNGGTVRSTYRQVCERHGVPFLDLYEVFAGQLNGWEPSSIFRDPMHIHHALAKAVGSFVTACILAIDHDRVGRLVSTPGVRQRYVPVAAFCSDAGTLSSRRTSLDEARILDLADGEGCRIDLPESDAIVALVCDLANSSGYLTLTGRDTFAACLKTDYYRGGRAGLVTSIVPVARPVLASGGQVELTVSSSADPQLSFAPKDYVAEHADVALMGVILRSPAASMAVREPFAQPQNLFTTAPQTVRDRFISDLQAVRHPEAVSA